MREEEEEKAREKTNFASGFFVFRRSEMWHPRRKRVGIIILAANGGRRRLAHHISPIRGRPKKRMADDMYTNRKQNSFICSVYVFPCFNTTQCDWCLMVRRKRVPNSMWVGLPSSLFAGPRTVQGTRRIMLLLKVNRTEWTSFFKNLIDSGHFLPSLGNYNRRAIFPETCKINQSSVDFHCKPL